MIVLKTFWHINKPVAGRAGAVPSCQEVREALLLVVREEVYFLAWQPTPAKVLGRLL